MISVRPKRVGLWAGVTAGILIAVSAGLFFGRFVKDAAPLNLASTVLSDTYRPVVNLPWVRYGADFGGVAQWQTPGISEDSERINSWLRMLGGRGVTAVVWFLFGDGRGSIDFDDSGFVRGLKPQFVNDYRKALDILKENRMQVIWVVVDFKIANPMQMERGVQQFGRAGTIEDQAKAKSFFDKALLPVVEDGYDRAQIAGWIVINEPENVLRDGSVSEDAMRTFIRSAAATIHRRNPKQPVSVGSADLSSMIHLSDVEGLNFLVFHHWTSSIPPPASYIRRFLQEELKQDANGKPIFIGEYNLGIPPSLDTQRFLTIAKTFGYSGVWPWSLHNRVDASSNVGIDLDPQFSELDPYVGAFRNLTDTVAIGRPLVRQTASSNDTDSLVSAKEQLLSNANQRIAEIEDGHIVEFHREHAVENMEWRQRILQRDLPVFQQQLSQALNERQRALDNLIENEAWVRRASSSDESRARLAETTSRQWVARIERQISTSREEINRQEADLGSATTQWRRHSYLSKEAANELTWLQWLKSALQQERALRNR